MRRRSLPTRAYFIQVHVGHAAQFIQARIELVVAVKIQKAVRAAQASNWTARFLRGTRVRVRAVLSCCLFIIAAVTTNVNILLGQSRIIRACRVHGVVVIFLAYNEQ